MTNEKRTNETRTQKEQLEERVFNTESSFWRTWFTNSAFYYKERPQTTTRDRRASLRKLNELK